MISRIDEACRLIGVSARIKTGINKEIWIILIAFIMTRMMMTLIWNIYPMAIWKINGIKTRCLVGHNGNLWVSKQMNLDNWKTVVHQTASLKWSDIENPRLLTVIRCSRTIRLCSIIIEGTLEIMEVCQALKIHNPKAVTGTISNQFKTCLLLVSRKLWTKPKICRQSSIFSKSTSNFWREQRINSKDCS